MAPLIGVVAVDIVAQPSRLEADDRVRLGIERLVSFVDRHRDRVPLDPVGAALKRLLDDETQQGARRGLSRKAPHATMRSSCARMSLGGRSKPGSFVARAFVLVQSLSLVRAP